MALGFVCPVCGFTDAASPPFDDGQGEWYQEICPSCGTQFGHDDTSTSHVELRRQWLQSGAKWWSPNAAPMHFNGPEQLRKAGIIG